MQQPTRDELNKRPYSYLPESAREGMWRYINHGIEPGSFLVSIIQNDFTSAIKRADFQNRQCLEQYADFMLSNHFSLEAFGSQKAYYDWVSHKKEERKNAQNNENRVHQTHCCSKHGCKYGEDDCPVANGIIKQDYPCEACDYEW